MPAHRRKVRWQVLLDTSESDSKQDKPHRSIRGGEAYELKGRSLVLLRLPKHVEAENDQWGAAALRRAERGVVAAPRVAALQ